jgi:hypothetical protein
LLSVAASRFHEASLIASNRLLYQCGQKVLYEHDINTNSLKQVEYSSNRPLEVEIGLTHETVALLATGWGAGEAATAIRVGLGINASWKEKVAALGGALLGYTAGRWAFKRTIPPCDSEQIIQLLNKTSGRELSQAIIKNNMNQYLILADRNSILTLNSQIPLLRQAFISFVNSSNGEKWRLDCNEPRFRTNITCFDFVSIERLQAKLADPNYVWTRSDYFESIGAPFQVTLWVSRHPDFVRAAMRPRVYGGITTNQALIEYGDSLLAAQAKQLRSDARSPFMIAVYWIVVITVGIVLVIALISFIVFLRKRYRAVVSARAS